MKVQKDRHVRKDKDKDKDEKSKNTSGLMVFPATPKVPDQDYSRQRVPFSRSNPQVPLRQLRDKPCQLVFKRRPPKFEAPGACAESGISNLGNMAQEGRY
jgi:hypothetical protein